MIQRNILLLFCNFGIWHLLDYSLPLKNSVFFLIHRNILYFCAILVFCFIYFSICSTLYFGICLWSLISDMMGYIFQVSKSFVSLNFLFDFFWVKQRTILECWTPQITQVSQHRLWRVPAVVTRRNVLICDRLLVMVSKSITNPM